eukprot:974978_1
MQIKHFMSVCLTKTIFIISYQQERVPMGQTFSKQCQTIVCACGEENTYDNVLKTESAFEYKNESQNNIAATQYEEFIKERHRYELQIAQFEQQLLQQKEALNIYKAQVEGSKDVDEYKQSRNEYDELVKDLQKYKESEQKRKEECDQYKHENTNLKRTKDELQHKLSQLSKIVDDIEAKSAQPTAPMTDTKDMLQRIMITAPVIDGERANSSLMVKEIMLQRYGTEMQELGNETSWLNESEDESSSHLETDEEMEIAQAREVEIKKKEENNEIMAMQKEIAQMKRSSSHAVHHVKSHILNKPESLSVLEDELEQLDSVCEERLLRSGTDRQWDRNDIIQQKKEMEDAMAALVESALTQSHKQ